MGILIKLGDNRWVSDYRSDGSIKWKKEVSRNGLILTKTGWKNLNITKHKRSWNTCSICGKKCYQSFGSQYEQICLNCADEWLRNSTEEMDKIKARLKEQQEFIENNKESLIKAEKETIEKWDKIEMLNKLESE
jgi:hypothetical protein